MSEPPPMTYRRLGSTDLRISKVALGGGGPSRLGLDRNATSAQTEHLIQTAVDLGINFIDTAPGYGTEKAIGAALRSISDPVYIATKVWCYSTEDVTDPDQRPITDPNHVVTSVEQSLTALGRDVVDLLQLHGVPGPGLVPMLENLLPAILRLQEQGKLRFIGITEHPGIDPGQDMAAAACLAGVFDSVMIQYGIFDQEAERRTLPLARKHNIGILCMCAARGALTDAGELANLLCRIKPGASINLDFLLEPPVVSYADAAFRFAAGHPDVHSILVGTGNPGHLTESTAAILGEPLNPSHRQRLVQHFGHLNGEQLWPPFALR